jgi:hypothetical protein
MLLLVILIFLLYVAILELTSEFNHFILCLH